LDFDQTAKAKNGNLETLIFELLKLSFSNRKMRIAFYIASTDSRSLIAARSTIRNTNMHGLMCAPNEATISTCSFEQRSEERTQQDTNEPQCGRSPLLPLLVDIG
jgi:hypothetical protein